MKIYTQYIPILLVLLFITSSCGKNDRIEDGDILVKVGNEILTKNDLAKDFPYGLSESDSTKFARAYIKAWIDSKLVGEIAAKNISDMSKIDEMVAKYRNELIMWEYRQRMYESHADKELSADSIATYYEAHKQDFIATRPYIKGIYIKIPDNAANINQLKKLYRSNKPQEIDQLEKLCYSEAIHYDYFRDKWIDWEQIESKIPYDFGNNPDVFIKNNKNIETSIGGFTYLLNISDFIPTGKIIPLEIASQSIKETLINQNRMKYDQELRNELFNIGLEDGEIKILCDLES
ncbi:MAG: hypothetical protein IKL35_00680 [Muribaculaceae bacterium]|nr:hypothetical protein [Muribaculaceae bacterium]